MSTFNESVHNGDLTGTLRHAVIYGSLWAIGTAWATGIRETVLLMLPGDTRDIILGELLSVGITTVLGIGLSYLVTRQCCTMRRSSPSAATESRARLQTLAERAPPGRG